MPNENGFSEEETRVLDKTRNLREKIIDGIVEENNGMPPTDSKTVRVLLEAMNGLDKAVVERADVRTKADAAGAAADVAAGMAELIRATSFGKAGLKKGTVPESLPDHLGKKDFVPGELDTKSSVVEIGDIVKED